MIYNIGTGGGGGGSNNVVEGYYTNGHFYDAPIETPSRQEIPGELNKIYIDLLTNNLYYYSGSEFVLSTASIQIERW